MDQEKDGVFSPSSVISSIYTWSLPALRIGTDGCQQRSRARATRFKFCANEEELGTEDAFLLLLNPEVGGIVVSSLPKTVS